MLSEAPLPALTPVPTSISLSTLISRHCTTHTLSKTSIAVISRQIVSIYTMNGPFALHSLFSHSFLLEKLSPPGDPVLPPVLIKT